ncbi:MAG: ATP-binding protein [Candidatus Aminicenantes bacterium]|jgi:AAA+ ATPase superfamily predicted ATPase
MAKDKLEYRQYVAFINREDELRDLRTFIDKEPSEILFLHGPKSSGKTTLLYKFFDQIQEEQKLDIKFVNLRETFTDVYEDFLKAFFQVERKGEKTATLESDINVGFFKISSSIEKKIREKRVDPFKVMKAEFQALREKGIKPVLIIDELQALDKIYINNDKDRQLITALFNFFVAMAKERHIAHIMIASSDGYFLHTVYTDSRLKQTSEFYQVDFLPKEDVMEWLLNLEKYSKITDYTLTKEEAGKIWDTVGGSMWEIQQLLSQLFDNSLDKVLNLHKKKMQGIISYYIGADDKKEKILRLFLKKDRASIRDFVKEGLDKEEVETLLRHAVRNNILYFDPVDALYYPQAPSYQWGIKLYFEHR